MGLLRGRLAGVLVAAIASMSALLVGSPAAAYRAFQVNTPYNPQYAVPSGVMAICHASGIRVNGPLVYALPGRTGWQSIYAVAHIWKLVNNQWIPVQLENAGLEPGGIKLLSGRSATFPSKNFLLGSGLYAVQIEVDWRQGGARINNAYYEPNRYSEYGNSPYKYFNGTSTYYCAAGPWITN